MSFSMHNASIPAFVQMLRALDGVLDKAAAFCAARKVDESVLLNDRLAPDMFPFTRQVQIACDFAKNTSARLAQVELPKFPDEEKTIADLKARIAKTLDFLHSLTPAQIDGAESRDVSFTVAGQPITLGGLRYLTQFALPNFYFHTTAAYAILRHNGVDLGKRDFIGSF